MQYLPIMGLAVGAWSAAFCVGLPSSDMSADSPYVMQICERVVVEARWISPCAECELGLKVPQDPVIQPPEQWKSTENSTNQHCSTSNENPCSTYSNETTEYANCSVKGATHDTSVNCSIDHVGGQQGQQCSTLGSLGEGHNCSVIYVDKNTKGRCSIMEKSAGQGNSCSTKNVGGASLPQCSIVAPKGKAGNYGKCSIAYSGEEPNDASKCSAFVQYSRCSVAAGTKGACTVISGASTSASQCSVQPSSLSNAGCSVMNANGTTTGPADGGPCVGGG